MQFNREVQVLGDDEREVLTIELSEANLDTLRLALNNMQSATSRHHREFALSKLFENDGTLVRVVVQDM